MAFWKDLGDVLESFATVAALAIGAVWTYFAFVRQRLGMPRVEIDIRPEELDLGTARLLRVHVTLRNTGSVVATSRSAELRMRGVLPLPEEIEVALSKNEDPVPSGACHLEWPVLCQRKWTFPRGEFEVEPGESDVIYADFFLQSSSRAVELYLYIANAAKPRQNIGWTRSILYQLSQEGASNVGRPQGQGVGVPAAPTAPADAASTAERAAAGDTAGS